MRAVLALRANEFPDLNRHPTEIRNPYRRGGTCPSSVGVCPGWGRETNVLALAEPGGGVTQ